MSTSSRARFTVVTAVVAAALAAATVVVHLRSKSPILTFYWWLGMVVILLCLLSFLKGRSFAHLPVAPGRTVAIIPAFEEPTENLHRTVRSLLAQTHPVDEIHVIDDGSRHHPVQPFDHPRVFWHRQENKGKRGAQVTVLRHLQAEGKHFDFVLTIDSDGEPFPDALEQQLRAMSNPKIQATTGMIYIRNFEETWVSRAADIDIGTSCVMMRSSRSMLGALETTSGALALYRAGLLYDHLDAYEVECGTGDDRWLALRALMRGEVVAVNEAGVVTDMPTTLGKTYRQRLRWARSWWWMLPFVYARLSFKQLISPTFGLLQLVITPIMLAWTVVMTVLTLGGRYHDPGVALVYLATYVVVRYGQAGLYVLMRPDLTTRQRWRSWLVGTPAAVFMNIVLLCPTRYWALFKLRDNAWQSRGLTARTALPGGRHRTTPRTS
ncbi:glycosyltransferase [Streptomyces sp. NPDC059680]|uniref:glycosyltransferase family 2 protein n=1 Tax=Streptomyces TaxID=1883 RepID=UPI001E4A0EFB|nr:glycosyltransferase [Streptomyces barringtoniae]MCC5477024.1 glycosyltransferase family 2 protein [Streptomyces barringtoniae]